MLLSEELVVIESGKSKLTCCVYPPEVLEAAVPLYENALVVKGHQQSEAIDPKSIVGILREVRWTGSAIAAKVSSLAPLPPSFRLAHCVIAQTGLANLTTVQAKEIKSVQYVALIPLED